MRTEAQRQAAQRYYQKNKARIAERTRNNRLRKIAVNPEIERAKSRAYYAANREKALAWKKNYRERNKDRINARIREQRAQRPQKDSDYLMREYGITLRDYSRMLAAQGGGCAICSAPPSQERRHAVDHCHTTGRIRGLLCGNCNSGIGKLRDDPALLDKAASYLRHGQSH